MVGRRTAMPNKKHRNKMGLAKAGKGELFIALVVFEPVFSGL